MWELRSAAKAIERREQRRETVHLVRMQKDTSNHAAIELTVVVGEEVGGGVGTATHEPLPWPLLHSQAELSSCERGNI